VTGTPPLTAYYAAVVSESVPAGDARVAVVVLAGGSGLRVGGDRNKAYLPLAGRTAVGISLRTMAAATPGLLRLVLVVRADDVDLAETTLAEEFPHPPVPVELVTGGASRHGSEERALHHLEPAIRAGELDLVLIHDAARPLCSPALVSTLVDAAAAGGGAVPGLAVDDLAAVADDGSLVPLVGRHVRIQTPQVFAAKPLLAAYHRAAETGFEGTIRWDTSRPNGQPRRKLDTSRAEELFGFSAAVPLREGIPRTVTWYRENR